MKKKKSDVGRPTIMTDETIRKLEEAFLNDATDGEACFIAGISESTFYLYQKEHPEFVDRKNGLKSMPVYHARCAVIEKIKGKPAKYKGKKLVEKEVPPDAELGLKYLERKKKDEFSLRMENTGKDGKPMIPENPFRGKTMEELLEIKKSLSMPK